MTFATTGLGEFSDTIPASDFNLDVFPPGAQLTVKHYYDLIAAQQAPSRNRGLSFWQRLVYDPANEPANGLTTEMTGEGIFTYPTGAQMLPVFAPNMIIGAPTRDERSWIFIGDSIAADGVGDGNLPTAYGGGYLSRAGYQSGDSFFIHGLGGRGAYHWVNNGSLSRSLLPAFNASVIALGTNDISNGLTKDQTMANVNAIASQARNAGHVVVLASTLPPRVSVGTSGNESTLYRATDLTNQFPYYTQNALGVGFDVGEYKDQFNAELIANKNTGSYPDDVIDLASAVTDPTTSSMWKLPAAQVSGTLSSNVAQFATQVSLSVSPPVGSTVVFDVGNATVQPVDEDTSAYNVHAVSGAGPYLVTIATNDAYQGGGQFGGRTAGNAMLSGIPIKTTISSDETHPSQEGHVAAAALALTKIQAAAVVNSYETEAQTLFDSFSALPNSTRLALINSTIRSFKDWGVWDNFEALHFQAAHDSQAYKLNWKNPATYGIVENVAPTFVADRGITGNGTSQFCTINGLIPSSGGTILAQDDIHIGQFNLTAGGATGTDFGSANSLMAIRGRAGTNAIGLVSTATGFSPTTGVAVPQHIMVVRSAANLQRMYANGVADNTSSAASTGLPDQVQLCRGGASAWSSRQIACTHIGNAQMSVAQLLAVSTIIRRYMVGVGAA
jgi:lysophospholipase L1-like esterase